ncbi:hypothetical protein HY386_01345 [Candidatus Daviesbacteria bacterium]|nr:hypothetical protein [Candidatus Daviesbacteria bacterium]
MIIFLIIYAVSRKFIVNKPFKTKNYIITIVLTFIIYYLLWVFLLNIFVLSAGIVSQQL